MIPPSESRYDTMVGKLLPFEYVMRYVDEEPNIHDYRSIGEVIDAVAITALRFAVLGEVNGATRLLTMLHDSGHDPFQAESGSYVFLKPCMYFAWDATASWPDWIAKEERTEDRLQYLEAVGRVPWFERFNGEWHVNEETAEKALVLADQSIPLYLPNRDGSVGGQVEQAEISVAEHCQYAQSPNRPWHTPTPFRNRYLSKMLWWRQGRYVYPYVQVYRSAALALALDIYLRLGDEEKAGKVLERMCNRFDTEEQLEMMACSRLAWKKVYLQLENPILRLTKIHPAKLRSGLSRAISIVSKRLRNGPKRRYKSKSMAQLTRIISQNTYLNCPYMAFQAPYHRHRPADKSGLVRRACSLRELVSVERRLGVMLPADYKELLSITNGMGKIWEGQHALEFFCQIDKVEWEEVKELEDVELPLLREGDLPYSGGNHLEWPLPTDHRRIRISGCNCGCGVDLWLVPQSAIQPSKQYFFNQLNKRTSKQKEELEHVVNEMYGSKERLEELEWALVEWTSWGFSATPYNGIRDLLERLAEKSLTQYRPWIHIFQPDHRIVKTFESKVKAPNSGYSAYGGEIGVPTQDSTAE